jgi:pSer/pThr/pTyr-binding forkhead associated (FHA) protein
LRYGQQDKQFTAADGEIALGRSLDNHIALTAVHVSRKHAKIVWEGPVPYIVNISQNGTCVKFEGSVRSQVVQDRLSLQGSGLIALAPHFGLSPTHEDIVKFSFS